MGLILSPIVWGHVWLSGQGVFRALSGWRPGMLFNTPKTDLAPKSAMPGLRHTALAHAAPHTKEPELHLGEMQKCRGRGRKGIFPDPRLCNTPGSRGSRGRAPHLLQLPAFELSRRSFLTVRINHSADLRRVGEPGRGETTGLQLPTGRQSGGVSLPPLRPPPTSPGSPPCLQGIPNAKGVLMRQMVQALP